GRGGCPPGRARHLGRHPRGDRRARRAAAASDPVRAEAPMTVPRVAPAESSVVLSRRATLNALAAAVDYAARIVIQLVLAPIGLTHRGGGGFGTWQVLQRLVGHATPAGGRPGEALKWVVARGHATTDDERKRHQVGTAVAVWALFLPLV